MIQPTFTSKAGNTIPPEQIEFLNAAGYTLEYEDGEYYDFHAYEDIDKEAHFNQSITWSDYGDKSSWYAILEIRADDLLREEGFETPGHPKHPLPLVAIVEQRKQEWKRKQLDN